MRRMRRGDPVEDGWTIRGEIYETKSIITKTKASRSRQREGTPSEKLDRYDAYAALGFMPYTHATTTPAMIISIVP